MGSPISHLERGFAAQRLGRKAFTMSAGIAAGFASTALTTARGRHRRLPAVSFTPGKVMLRQSSEASAASRLSSGSGESIKRQQGARKTVVTLAEEDNLLGIIADAVVDGRRRTWTWSAAGSYTSAAAQMDIR